MRGIPCDTREYINEETVVDKPGHAQLAELIPGLLTSLGILGTFVGLMQGLTSVDFSNAEGTIQSIPQLLSGMRFAFATSVAGISCSLLFNMFNRMAAGRAVRALDNFEDAFYELAMPRPLQPDVQMMCQKQDEEVRMARLAENVGNHVAASLEMAIGRAMAPLTQSLDTFIKCATREQVDGVRRIVGQFVQQMNTSLSGQMTALGDTMNAVNQGSVANPEGICRPRWTPRAPWRATRRQSGKRARKSPGKCRRSLRRCKKNATAAPKRWAQRKAQDSPLPTSSMRWRNPSVACR